MLREIINKEIHEIIKSPKFVFTFLLCTILILLSVVLGILDYKTDKKEYDKAITLNKQELEKRTSYVDIAAGGIKILKGPQVLTIIAIGIEADVGRGLKIASGSDPQVINSQYQSNPILALFGLLDIAFIVRVILSLLAILFTYDSITGEKERGTLGLVFSNQVPKDKFILGKVFGGFICLLISFIVPFILVVLILLVYPDIYLSGENLLRIVLLFVQFLLYISVFFMVGLFISCRTYRSTTSFLSLLIIWVVLVIIIPKISVMAAAKIIPIPSANDIAVKKEQFLRGLFSETDKQIRAFRDSNPPPAKTEDRIAWQDKIKKVIYDAADYRQNKYEKYVASVDRDYQLRKRAQNQLAINLSRLSPAGSLMFANVTIAQTGIDEYQRFLDTIRSYWPIWNSWIDSKIREPSESKTQGKEVDLSSMPQFSYGTEQILSSIKRALPDFGIMCFMIILFFFAAYRSFIKYDVR